MKKVKLLFFVLVLPVLSIAQEFAPVGATWIFTKEFCFSNQYCGYYSVKSLKDTLIQNKTVSVLKKEYFGNELGIDTTFYMYGENKQVFIYDFLSDTFNLIYDFNLQAGDTITIKDSTDISGYYFDPFNRISFFQVRIDSVSGITINNKNLIVQYTSPTLESQGQFLNRTIERIGNVSHFLGFNDPILTAGYTGVLICYSDSTIYYPTEANCSVVGIESKGIKNSILVYPNPFSDELIVSGIDNSTYILTVEDYMGKQVYINSGIANQNRIKVNLDFLTNGIYFIKINTTKKSLTQKINKL